MQFSIYTTNTSDFIITFFSNFFSSQQYVSLEFTIYLSNALFPYSSIYQTETHFFCFIESFVQRTWIFFAFRCALIGQKKIFTLFPNNLFYIINYSVIDIMLVLNSQAWSDMERVSKKLNFNLLMTWLWINNKIIN